MRLNGWQRLWVVSSLLMGLYLACIEARVYPDMAPVAVESFQDVDTFEASMQLCDAFKNVATPAQRAACREKFVKPAPERYMARENYRLRVAAYQSLGHERRQFVGLVLMIWLTTCAALYAGGWLVAWVARGFRKPAA